MNDDTFNDKTDVGLDARASLERPLERMRQYSDEQNPMLAQGQTMHSAKNFAASQLSQSAGVCPHCGATLEEGADYCEVCHHYASLDVCSFCGTRLAPNEAFCHECGNPRKGITCPVCHTVNEFAFCIQCGTPLTVEAQQLYDEVRQSSEYKLLEEKIRQLDNLSNESPCRDDRDRAREEASEKLRIAVLRLLATDEGRSTEGIEEKPRKMKSVGEIALEKQNLLSVLSDMLDKMALKPMASPVKARNYAMAIKPAGVRMAWVCNYKHAMHSSPCGCAKPHLGGKWVILDKDSISHIKDDQ